MPRIAVDIKWDTNTFKAFDKITGKPITEYSNLSYGGNKTDLIDDPIESVKTINLLTKVPVVGAVCTGWCDVP